MAARTSEEAGCVPSCRRIIRPLGHLCDQAHRAAHAARPRQQLRQAIPAMGDHQRETMPHCVAAHWEHALRYRRTKGMGQPRRGSHAASGMRLRRRLAKHHDGIRCAATRQHSMQISQAMQSLSLDVAECIEQGPQMAELPCV